MSNATPTGTRAFILRLLEHVKFAISLASFFGTIAFIIAKVVNSPKHPPVMYLSIVTGVTFISTLILLTKDSNKRSKVLSRVRPMLMAQPDMRDCDFCRHFPDGHPELIIEIRMAIGNFFNVPREKIHPLHYLIHYEFKLVEPGFHFEIIQAVLNRYRLSKSIYKFNTNTCSTVLNFVEQVAEIVESV